MDWLTETQACPGREKEEMRSLSCTPSNHPSALCHELIQRLLCVQPAEQLLSIRQLDKMSDIFLMKCYLFHSITQ